jgi:precorrin-6B methylase 2
MKAWIPGLLLAAACSAGAQDAERRSPFITTPSDVVERMLRLAGAGPSDLVVDLGSGDGRIVIDAARKFGARGLGIELDPLLVTKSRDNVREAQLADRVSIVHGDVLKADISQASVVTVYLLPSLIDRLQPRFIEELRPGTRIVSHAFQMVSWKPDRAETMRIVQRHQGQGDESLLYLWIVPAKARGLWEGKGEGGAWQIRVHQNFQEIELDAMLEGKPLPVARACLSGSDIGWQGPGHSFRGRVEGDSITGDLVRDGRSRRLVLKRRSG